MGDPGSPPSAPRTRDGHIPAETVTVDAAATTAATTLVARSSLEAFLWVFVTRLIAILTAGLTGSAPTTGADGAAAPDLRTSDPARARRVAASRGEAVGGAPVVPPGPTIARTGDDRSRAVAVTAATAVVGAAAAFAVGRRRGSR